MSEKIHIFYTINDNYACLLGVSLLSLIENAKSPIEVHVLFENLSRENRERIKALETESAHIDFFNMSTFLNFPELLSAAFFSPVTFYRLFIPQLFPDVKRGIYLDSDTVIVGDITGLYNTDLQGNFFGAVQDYSIHDFTTILDYSLTACGIPYENYINSGVLLIDFELLREHEFDRKLMAILKEKCSLIAPDQEILNFMALNHILYLSPEWNLMPSPYTPKVAEPKIVHYNLKAKPWHYEVECGEYFWKYALRSAFYGEIMTEQREFKNNPDAEIQESSFVDAMSAAAARYAKLPGFVAKMNEGKIERL
ncbi:glycosyltransferase family 8 protein [Candidatus Saccharibacteria bacterium]|nr:glycosyltransferase family 8 protein [Candidatus Saccharibacteria bacterium]